MNELAAMIEASLKQREAARAGAKREFMYCFVGPCQPGELATWQELTRIGYYATPPHGIVFGASNWGIVWRWFETMTIKIGPNTRRWRTMAEIEAGRNTPNDHVPYYMIPSWWRKRTF